jgi:uncharacterized protein (TIGR02996 family)
MSPTGPPLEEAFFRSIAAEPEDDAARLVYADWLDDNGEPERAEFIRLQCARAAAEGAAGDVRRLVDRWEKGWRRREQIGFLRLVRAALEAEAPRRGGKGSPRREARLIEAHHERWLGGLPFPVEFRRGFPEVLDVEARDYLQYADLLARVAPVQAVRLMSYTPWEGDTPEGMDDDEEDQATLELVKRLAACPELSRWAELDFVACPGGEVLEALLSSPHLTGLRRVVASGNETGEGVGLMVADERFSHLRWLDLYDGNSASGRPGDDDFIDIVTSPHLARLEHLDYGTNNASDDGAAALASSPTMTRLRSLNLCENYVSPVGLRALAHSPTLTSLRHLNLFACMGKTPLDDGAFADLLSSPLFTRLTALDFSSNAVSDEGVRRLAATPAAVGLRALVLGPRRGDGPRRRLFTTASVRALAESRHLARLRRLELPSVPIDDEAALALARSRRLRGLRELVVKAGPGLTEAGRKALLDRFAVGVNIEEAKG